MDKETFYMGLDMGTSSVGWAVTDEGYHLLRAKGKDMWGVRLFEEAEGAKDRKNFRCARRKRNREVMRIRELKLLFADEIEKKDAGFFKRLEESMLWKEDRSDGNRQPFSLFCDQDGKQYTDVEYYKQYPTIFHLRKELIESEEPHDVRLLYLALLHMFKHRGHFLHANLSAETTDRERNFSEVWKELCRQAEAFGLSMNRTQDIRGLEELLYRAGEGKRKTYEKAVRYLNLSKNQKREMEVLKLICGMTIRVQGIFGGIDSIEENSIPSFSFRDHSFEEKEEVLFSVFSEEETAFFMLCKELHDLALQGQVLRGYRFLSEARVSSYEKHREDLKKLKRVVKRCGDEAYYEMFQELREGIANYSAYAGSVNCEENKYRRNDFKGKMSIENRTKERFYKYVIKVISARKGDPEVKEILEEIKRETFLPKQMTAENHVISNQIHLREMKVILHHASKYLPFLKDTDEEGRTVADRIMMLFSFSIPYYIGPLGTEYSGKKGYHVWAKRKEGGKIYPWNLKKKIDLFGTAEEYIKRTIRRCMYLSGEDVLPKHSMIYQKYLVLEELNSIRVHGEKLPVSIKQRLYHTLFLTGDHVSRKEVEDILIASGMIRETERGAVSGLDAKVYASLSTLGSFKRILETEALQPEDLEMIEKLVFWITVFGEDQGFVYDLIQSKYGEDCLDDIQIRKILNLNIHGWGSLSEKFFEVEGISKENGIKRNIMTALWETQETLMELLGEGYTYRESLENRVNELEHAFTWWKKEELDEFPLSACHKRMVWQVLTIAKEILEVRGKAPKRLFLKLSGTEEKAVEKKESRKKKLLQLYQSAGKEDLKKDLEKRTEAELRMKKMYLYYVQQGRCMYTGRQIPLEDLMDYSKYDIDHIYPRHFVKDERIEDNLVLVSKESNLEKGDRFPLSGEVQDEMYEFWNSLHDAKFISDEKFSRLIRRQEFSDEEKAEFIRRDFMQHGKLAEEIRYIFGQVLPATEIVFINASLISDFRRKYHLTSVSCINDFHHAGEAYLSTAVGNAYFTKFTAHPLAFIRSAREKPEEEEYQYNMDKMFRTNISRNGEKAWSVTDSVPTISVIKKTLKKMTPIVTKRCFCSKGGICNKDTIFSAKLAKEDTYLPQKLQDTPLADVTKYGGRTSINNMCYTLVEYQVKDKKIRSIEALPAYLGEAKALTEEKIREYLLPKIQQEHKRNIVEDFRICIRIIKYRALLKIDGYFYYLGGKTGSRICIDNALQCKVDEKHAHYIGKLEKAVNSNFFGEKRRNGELVITREKNSELYQYFLEKMKNPIYRKRVNFVGKLCEEKREEFEKLDMEEQCRLLMSVVAGFQSGARRMDLHLIGGTPNSGGMIKNKKISECGEVLLIHQSATGLFETVVDLLKV